MHPRFLLLRLLADGRFHSGRELGEALGVSRASVWNLVRALPELGVEVFAVHGKGYRLAEGFEPLAPEPIHGTLDAAARPLLAGLEVYPSVDSTNHVLHERAARLPSGSACLAEHQARGRGRRGRGWVSPYGANLYASLLWRFDLAPAALGPLSVAVGVLVAGTLAEQGARGLGLKWPNDVLWEGRKLAGILIEVGGEATGPAQAVIGVGVNANMPAGAGAGIDQPWVDLRTVLGQAVDRNRLAAALLSRLVTGLDAFARVGFGPLREAWDRLDVARDRPVRVATGGGPVDGTCRGLDPDGALLVEVAGHTRRFLSGEVSLRVGA
jgi:BirA family biotin operon repressor/biotin-[acetyl-CoA-carboxylase] ligase